MNALAIDPQELYRFDRAAPVVASPEALTEQDVARYHTDGFIAVENVLKPDEAADAKIALGDLIHGRIPAYDGLTPEPEFREKWEIATGEERAALVRKVFYFCSFEPRLNALATQHAALSKLLARLLGEPSCMIQDMALLKPPHIGTEKPWHQDAAYFGYAPPEKIIGVWIALDPATAENGCMHALPGTHREGPVAHTHLRDCQIPDEKVQIARDVLVPLRPGGAMFFSALLHHGTPPNRSPLPRWALQFHYAAASCEPIDRLRHAELFFEDAKYAGCRGGTGTPIQELTP